MNNTLYHTLLGNITRYRPLSHRKEDSEGNLTAMKLFITYNQEWNIQKYLN